MSLVCWDPALSGYLDSSLAQSCANVVCLPGMGSPGLARGAERKYLPDRKQINQGEWGGLSTLGNNPGKDNKMGFVYSPLT